jgi:hypothetical protein
MSESKIRDTHPFIKHGCPKSVNLGRCRGPVTGRAISSLFAIIQLCSYGVCYRNSATLAVFSVMEKMVSDVQRMGSASMKRGSRIEKSIVYSIFDYRTENCQSKAGF